MIRFFDITLSFILILIFFPLILLIILYSKKFFKKPIFIQERIGINKKRFKIFKLRTLPENFNQNIPSHYIKNSIIKKNFFFYLRKYKIDEIPQLLNIFINQMSFVGYRPCLINQHKIIALRYKKKIFNHKPGLTGYAQLMSVNMSTPKKMINYELKLYKKLSIINYFMILFKTFIKIIKS